MSRPLFFYSAWPLGYHNPEAERKALGLAGAGYRVVYTAGIGMRNPRPSSARKLVDRGRRKLRARAGAPFARPGPALETAALVVAPPRQLAPVRRLNVAWVERQLRACLSPWDEAVAWIRYPTPELVAALPRLRPAAVVYESVDADHLTPGVTGRWTGVFADAERALVDQADAIVVPGEALAERFRPLHPNVKVIPHGVDLPPPSDGEPWSQGRVTVGFVGRLDYRLDVPILRRVASAHSDWLIKLVGPVGEGFDPGALADLPNVSFEPAIPHERVAETVASFRVGIMPYYDHPHYRYSSAFKGLEVLAAGRPAVARPSAALHAFSDHMYFANTPEEFVTELERAIDEDSPARARARRAAAEASTWNRRLGEIERLLDELLDHRPEAPRQAS